MPRARSSFTALALAGTVLLAGCGGGSTAPPVPPAGATTDAPVREAVPLTTSTATAPPPSPTAPPSPPDAPTDPPLPPARALGQMMVARFAGTAPSPALLRRVRRGEVGGVILFKDNVAGGGATTRQLVSRLQRAARRGGNPPLLVSIDQEGGRVRRLPGPPTPDAAGMTSEATARAQGRRTARLLRDLGINVDLAPVADVSAGLSSFLGRRAFGTTPRTVAERACGFVDGLRSGGVAATLKHFPGLGAATTSTDFDRTVIPGGRARLRRDYAAYRRCAASPTTLVMVSSAIYPDALGPDPALLTRATYARELRRATGDDPLTISDDLETPSVLAHAAPSRRAINAGLDLLLYARTEQASAAAYPRLLADVRAHRIPARRVQASASRILALKRLVAGDG
ncbi:glycoside hydrolase family 3 N-terminal domain-containing protein [Patulibacter sp. NPDC049589]|uniref:glycoside hydrolase family 3 N-terminal domain-containing protein n=1 Tax=Patulibacter sp. NPDC049589 TaxID=3154731 RepID=UPI003441AFB0